MRSTAIPFLMSPAETGNVPSPAVSGRAWPFARVAGTEPAGHGSLQGSASERQRDAGGVQEPVTVSVVRDFAVLARRAAEWNALLENAQTNTVFQTFEAHASWWKAFGRDVELCMLVAETRGALIGVAPLMVTRRRTLGGERRVVQFIGTRSFDYADFIVVRNRLDVVDRMLHVLVSGAVSFDAIYLRNVPEHSPTLSRLAAFFAATPLHADVRRLYEAPTRLFSHGEDDLQLPNKKSLKRHYNYFRRSGTLEFRDCRTAGEAQGFLDAFFEQHVRRRAVTDSPSDFNDPRSRDFFRALVPALASKGWLLFTVVLFDGRPIAMHFGFEYRGTMTWYKPSFDVAYGRHSPGEVLIRHLLQQALARRLRELDFTIGAEPFKYRFANHVRYTAAVQVFRRRGAYRWHRIVSAVGDWVEKRSWARRVGKAVLSWWHGTRPTS